MGRDFHKARKPVKLEELTPTMLAPIHKAADKSMLGQTVWPSYWYGAEEGYMGHSSLLTSMAAAFYRDGDRIPENAAKDSLPLVTILPKNYWPVHTDETGQRFLRVEDPEGDWGYRDVPLGPLPDIERL